jgi:hypothetical protein
LIIESDARPAVQTVRVIGFEDLLRPVIERAVADQNAKAAGREIGASLRRKASNKAGHADYVVRALPGGSL